MPQATATAPRSASTDPAARKEFPTALPLMRREIDRSDIRLVRGDDGFNRLTFSVASENPVERWYGSEILQCDSDSIRMDRIKRGAAPYLWNHDIDDCLGMVEDARIVGKRLVVDVKMFKTPRSEEVAQMIDGGLRNVSLLYRIYEVLEDTKKQQYTMTVLVKFAASTVTIPADPTVGIGRAAPSG